MKMTLRIFFSYHDPGSTKSKIYAGKSTKRGFSKKALTEIETFFLFKVQMNPLKAWNTKLEAAIFLLSKILYMQCDIPGFKYNSNIFVVLCIMLTVNSNSSISSTLSKQSK